MNVSRVAIPYAKGLLMPRTSSSAVVATRFSSTRDNVHPGYKKIKEKYAKFQVDDGVPVHLKGGAFDRFLYYTTLLGCGVGLVMCGEYYYSAAFPKKC